MQRLALRILGEAVLLRGVRLPPGSEPPPVYLETQAAADGPSVLASVDPVATATAHGLMLRGFEAPIGREWMLLRVSLPAEAVLDAV